MREGQHCSWNKDSGEEPIWRADEGSGVNFEFQFPLSNTRGAGDLKNESYPNTPSTRNPCFNANSDRFKYH